MEKKFVLALILLSVNYFGKAQSTQTQNKSKAVTSNMQLGLKAGVNISNIQIKNNEDAYDPRTGFHVGALAHIHISDHFAVQPEVMYSTQGAEAGILKLKQEYINVPVLLQLMANNGFRLETGPQACFLISAKNKNGDLEFDVKDQLKTVTFAWSFGASYLSKTGLGLDARYNLGISNINDDNASSPESKNHVWQVGVFYQFMQ